MGVEDLPGFATVLVMGLFFFSPIALLSSIVMSAGSFGSGAMIEVGERIEIKRQRSAWSIPRGDVTDGFVTPVGSKARVELTLVEGRTVAIAVESLGEGEKLLESLGLDRANRRARVGLGSTPKRAASGILIGLLVFVACAFVAGTSTHGHPLSDQGFLTWLLAQVAGTWLGLVATRPSEIVVGHEGFEIIGPFRKRYIDYADVERVDRSGTGLVAFLKGGTHLRFGTGFSTERNRVDALLLRLREAMAARVSEPLAAPKLAVLARNGRNIRAWREDLARATANGSAYREPLFSDDDLAAIVDSPVASPEQRIGAAMALATRDSAAARERLAHSAACVANPRLRVALEHAASSDDEGAIAAALEAEAEARSEAEAASPRAEQARRLGG